MRVCIVNQPIEDAVTRRGIADLFVPTLRWNGPLSAWRDRTRGGRRKKPLCVRLLPTVTEHLHRGKIHFVNSQPYCVIPGSDTGIKLIQIVV